MKYNSFYRYIYPKGKGYEIVKDNENYGTYRRLEDALYERDRLINANWDWDDYMSMPETINGYIHINLPPFDHTPRYITVDNECWVVRGKGTRAKYYGTYYTEKEALDVAKIYNANISHKNKAYRVQRRDPVTTKVKYYGRYKKYEDAVKRVKELLECDWEIN